MKCGKKSFSGCPKLTNIIDTNSIHFQCDLNRGGYQRFLCRQNRNDHDHGDDDDDDNHNGKSRHRVYFSSLRQLILCRILKKIEIPIERICSTEEEDLELYTNSEIIRRTSVVYCMMLHGVAMHY